METAASHVIAHTCPGREPRVDLAACLDGDGRAWRLFLAQYGPTLRKAVQWTLARKGGRAAEADVDDVVQNVLFRLVRGAYRLLATYDPARSSLATWLCVVARSAALDHVRDKRTAVQVGLDECGELAAREEELEETLALPAGLLTARQRQVVEMVVARGMDNVEISRAMDIHPQTVRSLRHSAVARLREYYAARGTAFARGGV